MGVGLKTGLLVGGMVELLLNQAGRAGSGWGWCVGYLAEIIE